MDFYFDDYDAYPEESVVRILPDRIELSGGRIILFDECARNFRRYIGNTSDAKYIGEKDTDDGSIIFYASPRPVMVKFLPRIFSKSVQQRMDDRESQMKAYGYSLTDSNM